MVCCPPAPSVNVGSFGDQDIPAQDTNIRRGESVECYMRRAGNSTGRMDDKTEHIPDKILNTDIPIRADASVNVQFRLTPNSTRTATTWQLEYEGGIITNFSGLPAVTFSSSGVLTGTFAPEYHGKSIKVQVSALDGVGEIDKRGFTFSPVIANGSNEIKFLHPLPGAHVTSPFGPRRPPITGASSTHGGADFAHASGKVADVVAAADGEVVFTGTQNGGAGNYIKVQHLNAAGKHLCTTVYMHLAKFYVTPGQKVAAGQKLGLEGNTGVGTGPHLHFECRLPNGTKIDPVPLIRGSLEVALVTNPDNSAALLEPRPADQAGVLTDSNVTAKENGCEAFGPDYPADPTETDEPVPTEPITDPFERAWFFTMTHEVSPAWTTTSPSDPEVAQGLIETAVQRKKTGYKVFPNLVGGETKFGIAQGPNPGIRVRVINYAEAKQTGYNNYWKRGPEALAATKPRTAIMLFDMNYLHGVGNANFIRSAASLGALSDEQAVEALAQAQREFMQASVLANPQRQVYIKGWLKRNAELLDYVKSL